MAVWIYGDIHMCGVASLIVKKLWSVTQIWLMILVGLWRTFRTAFFVCLYRLFEVSYDCLNIWWYTHVWSCLTNCEETVRCDADLIVVSCEDLKDLSNGVFRMSLSTFWGELWLIEYMEVISQVWCCLTNCEKMWGVTLIWLMIPVRLWKTFRTAFPVFLYRLFEVSYDCLNIWWYTHVWSCLNNCEETVRCYADLINDSCEALKCPFERRFPYVSIDFLRWAMTVWIYGDIHMCGVASLIVRKLWGVTQVCLMILVRLWKTFRTAFFVCLYRLFEVSYDCLNIWWYTHVRSCLTNCEKTVRFDADLIDDSCEDLKYLSNSVFLMSLSIFWGELWLFEYMGVISQVWGCLTDCEKTVRYDADLIDDFERPFERRFPMILVRLWKTFRTAFSVCLYRLFEVSYGCLNMWLLYHKCEVASLIAKKLWGVTQIWLMILVRI